MPCLQSDGTPTVFTLPRYPIAGATSTGFPAPGGAVMTEGELTGMLLAYLSQAFKAVYFGDEGVVLPDPVEATGYGTLDFSE